MTKRKLMTLHEKKLTTKRKKEKKHRTARKTKNKE